MKREKKEKKLEKVAYNNHSILYWVFTSYACGGLVVNNSGTIIESAPIFKWTVGKQIHSVLKSFDSFEIVSDKEVIVETKVVNLKNYRKLYDVYIGRGSIWGNPFIIGKDGNRSEVIEKYRIHAMKFTKQQLLSLKGKTLGCYCKPLACHGDILVNLIERSGI